MSRDACERRLDARLFPRGRCGGRGPRAGNVGSLAGAHGHAFARGRDGDAALFHEHAEYIVARPGEEARAAHRDQPERAADLYLGGSAGRPLEQHPAGSKTDLAARIDEIAVDGDPRPLAQLEPGVRMVSRESAPVPT
jgi:hypothetical protein